MVLRNGSALSESLALSAASDEPSTSQPIRVDELDHYDEDWIRPFPLKDGVKIRKGEKFSDYYTLYEEIGEGKFGKVYRCIEKATGLTLAAKCIKIRKDTDFEKVEKEVNIMTQMRHKCIAQIYDAFATDSNDVILIMEIVQGGELFDRVADDSYILTEMAVALIMFQICEAIRYIHSQNIIHLDLKPENIMCVSQTSNKIKLIDFGLAQWYDGSKDLILSGQSPFLGETLAHTYCNVEKGRWMFCEEFRENGISDDAKDFISRLLIVEKEKRILPDECLRHCWLLKNRERAALAGAASRAISPALLPCEQQPLAVEKLRSYVKNKKFRRLVFGVLFVNSVMRMLRTLQQNKSSHGIDYVKKEEINIVKENEEKPQTPSTTRRKVRKEKERNNGEDLAKKRSKSEARRTVDQQRTRSSTEHTSTKKQRQDNEQEKEGEGGNIKFVADDLTLYERERSHTTTEKRKKLVKRKVSKPQTPRTKKKMILVRKRRESTVAPTDGISVEKGLNGLNHLRQQRISKKFVKSSNSMDESPVVGHDVFDFRLLRMKLQNRIMG
uniref:Protein kinase domain-containing protein n=1 Tax=Meloidogyne javanica TaxID=6303 RepID=A0A915M7L3_MELJA